MNADKIIAQSVLCGAKTIAVRGVGRGRKVCPACRSIVVGGSRRTCNYCGHTFTFSTEPDGPRSKRGPDSNSKKFSMYVEKSNAKIQIKRVNAEIADLYAKLAKAHAKLADLS